MQVRISIKKNTKMFEDMELKMKIHQPQDFLLNKIASKHSQKQTLLNRHLTHISLPNAPMYNIYLHEKP